MLIRLARLAKSIVAIVIYPIATIFSFPKMLVIYCDSSIRTGKFACGKADNPQHTDCCNKPVPENTIKRMKLLVTSKYKISLSYLRSQAVIHRILFFVLPLCIAGEIFIHSEDIYDPNSRNQGQKTWNFDLRPAFRTIVACTPSVYGFIRTLFVRGNDTCFISAIDEITYPFKRLCYKNPSRLIERLIARKSRELGTKESLELGLASTNLPKLNQEFKNTKNIPKIFKFLDSFCNDTGLIDRDAMNLVKEYVFLNSLIFSAGKSLNPNKLKMLDNLCKPISLRENKDGEDGEDGELETSAGGLHEVRINI